MAALAFGVPTIVDVQRDPTGEACLVGGEEHHGFRDLLGLADTPLRFGKRGRLPGLPRRVQFVDFAKTAAFLVSADAGYITGQNMLADGGLNRSI